MIWAIILYLLNDTKIGSNRTLRLRLIDIKGRLRDFHWPHSFGAGSAVAAFFLFISIKPWFLSLFLFAHSINRSDRLSSCLGRSAKCRFSCVSVCQMPSNQFKWKLEQSGKIYWLYGLSKCLIVFNVDITVWLIDGSQDAGDKYAIEMN